MPESYLNLLKSEAISDVVRMKVLQNLECATGASDAEPVPLEVLFDHLYHVTPNLLT